MMKTEYDILSCDVNNVNNVNKLNDEELSDEANDILSNYENIIYFQEILDHDGYDSRGPKSDLWDLYTIIEINNDYIFYHYHWENWYRKNQKRKYKLYIPPIKLSETTKENIDYFHIKSNDTKFNKAFIERSNLFSKG